MGIIKFLFGRILVRMIGLNVRYLFFKLLGKKNSYNDFKTPIINKDNDYDEKGLQQDMYNALVGVLVILLIIVILKIIW